MTRADGYSGTSQTSRFGIESGQRIALDPPPAGWSLADPPPDPVHVDVSEPADLMISVMGAADQLPGRLPDLFRLVHLRRCAMDRLITKGQRRQRPPHRGHRP